MIKTAVVWCFFCSFSIKVYNVGLLVLISCCIRFPLEELYLEFICHVHRLARNTPNYCEGVYRLLFELSEIFRLIPEFDPKESKQLFNREINHLKYLIDTVDDYFRQSIQVQT